MVTAESFQEYCAQQAEVRRCLHFRLDQANGPRWTRAAFCALLGLLVGATLRGCM